MPLSAWYLWHPAPHHSPQCPCQGGFLFPTTKGKKQSPLIPKWTFPAECNTVFLSVLFRLCITNTRRQRSCPCYWCNDDVAINLSSTGWRTKPSLWGQFSSKYTCSSQCEQRGTERERSTLTGDFSDSILMAVLQHRTCLHTYKTLMELH